MFITSLYTGDSDSWRNTLRGFRYPLIYNIYRVGWDKVGTKSYLTSGFLYLHESIAIHSPCKHRDTLERRSRWRYPFMSNDEERYEK